ncbi:MAG: mechanosensitive ion channel [Aquabacterium sp.]|nr:mechanosensitive ion channel [Aquabacterium sp.]
MNGIDSLPGLLAALARPTALVELGLLLGCLALSWLVCTWLRPRDVAAVGEAGTPAAGDGIWFGQRGFDGALFPVLALALAVVARLLMRGPLLGHMPVAVFHLAVPVLASLALIRVSVRVLHAAFPNSALVRALERTLSWGVWIIAVLWITGLLPLVLAEMDAVSWKIGGAPVSLRSLFEGALSAVAVLLLMLWLSATIESRLLRASTVHLSVRKIAANATRAVLLLVGLLVALSAAGIPLGALGVMGGAVGVGIGLGLQRLAANYVSGFVILAERSLRIGDLVRVDNFEGRISDITTRYTLIRAPSGRESLVPNELLITQRVENLTYADSKLVLTTVVQVGYGTDVDALIPQLVTAVAAVPRVLDDPSPGVRLSAFADSGLELTIAFWIDDPDNGQVNAVGEVNLAILRLLNAQGVEIPFPQRVVHGLPAAAAADAAAAPAVDLAAQPEAVEVAAQSPRATGA